MLFLSNPNKIRRITIRQVLPAQAFPRKHRVCRVSV